MKGKEKERGGRREGGREEEGGESEWREERMGKMF